MSTWQPFAKLRHSRDFRRVYTEGKSYRAPVVVAFILETGELEHRLGIVASRKVGKAVRRNRAKRILREAHRHLVAKGGFDGLDTVLVARSRAPFSTCLEVEGQLEALYTRAGLLTGKFPVGHNDINT